MDIEGILNATDHRPWPLPNKPWALQMQWLDLAFLHWRVPFETLRPLVPAALDLDTFDGGSWIGITPFQMANVRVRIAPPIPTASRFPELNVRTYVRANGRAGVWFFSLDAASLLAVGGARFGCDLPYFSATMSLSRDGETVSYGSRRTAKGAPAAEFRARYRPAGPAGPVVPGSLERWLTERYCLFTVTGAGRVFELDIHHHPWPLQPAAAEIEKNTMAEAARIDLPGEPPLVHYSSRLDVLAWPPVPVED